MRAIAGGLLSITLLLFGLVLYTSIPSEALNSDSKADRIVVIKSAHTMTLYAGDRPLKTYNVALGRGHGSGKRQQDDHETPEGHYIIDGRNGQSRFHLALHLSYPTAAERARAHQQGVSPGGDIMIHGIELHLAWLGRLHHLVDWTDGCIAVTNKEMNEVWKAVPLGTPIEIRH